MICVSVSFSFRLFSSSSSLVCKATVNILHKWALRTHEKCFSTTMLSIRIWFSFFYRCHFFLRFCYFFRQCPHSVFVRRFYFAISLYAWYHKNVIIKHLYLLYILHQISLFSATLFWLFTSSSLASREFFPERNSCDAKMFWSRMKLDRLLSRIKRMIFWYTLRGKNMQQYFLYVQQKAMEEPLPSFMLRRRYSNAGCKDSEIFTL